MYMYKPRLSPGSYIHVGKHCTDNYKAQLARTAVYYLPAHARTAFLNQVKFLTKYMYMHVVLVIILQVPKRQCHHGGGGTGAV